MEYDSNILNDETNPKFTFKTEYDEYPEIRKGIHSPTTSMKYSVVWYSQIITQKLGQQKFTSYIKKFNYGNQNISGDFGKNNGLTKSWLSSSLKISSPEQINFLQQLLDNKFAISGKTQSITKDILFIENLPNNWQMHGKTDSCVSKTIKNKMDGLLAGFKKKSKKLFLLIILKRIINLYLSVI
jgi:beta-lactamase class D